MENILTEITDYLLTQSWQIVVLAGVIAAVSLTLKNKSAHVRYLLWLIVLAKCLVPPLHTIPLAILPQQKQAESVPVSPTAMPAVAVEVDTAVTEPLIVPSVPAMTPPAPTITERLARVTIRQWLAFGWIIGATVFVLGVVIKALRTNRRLKGQQRPLPVELQTGIGNLFAGLGIKSFPKVWLIDGIGQPFVWGPVRGSIYLPGNFSRLDSEESRRGVLGHELSHVMRFDAAVNLLQIIAQAVYWFHPFVWWANKKIRAEREKCCDEVAIARLNTLPKDYSTAIVNTLIAERESTQPVPSLAVAGPVKNIEDRIKTIMKPGKKFYKRPSIVVVIGILLLALVIVPTTLALTERAKDNLEILDVKFEPIHQGKNVVRVRVRNNSDEERVFGIHIYTRSPDYGRGGVGWGRPFFDNIKPKETKWVRCAFHIQGPVTDNTWLRLKFYNPDSQESYDYEKYFQERRYVSSDLEHREPGADKIKPASKKQSEQIKEIFEKIQGYMRDKKYEQAWRMFTEDYRDADQISTLEKFKKVMEPDWGFNLFHWEKDEFLDLQPKSVNEKDDSLTLTAIYESQTWTIDFVQQNARWKIDWILGYTPRVLLWENWEQRLLPAMEKRSTKHFDIYYYKDSTGEKDIDQISEQKEEGFREICRFLGEDSDVRICLVFFQDGQTKQMETGHQGAGWAYGNTIVEVYNEKQKLEPYHETTHVLMRPFGDPPALFNEGFAVYMSERLGAHALEDLGGGESSLYQRVRELKSKGDWIGLGELLTYTDIGPAWSQPPVSYAEAGAFVKFLIEEYERDKFLQAYNTLKNSGDKTVQQQNIKKLSQIYGKSLQEIEKQWEDAFLLSQPLESVEKLQELGKGCLTYANDHEAKYPDALQELYEQDYVDKKDFEWFLENVEYLGKGKTVADPLNMVIAYDKTLLEKGKGTNVLFNDTYVGFENPEQLKKRGITGPKKKKAAIERGRSAAAVYKQLDEIVDLSGLRPEMTFGEALEELKNSVEPALNIVVLWRDLEDKAGIDRTTPINMNPISAIRLGTALGLLLKSVSAGEAELGYVVEDGVIVIATKESLPEKLETRVYDIYGMVGSPDEKIKDKAGQKVEEFLRKMGKPTIAVESRFIIFPAEVNEIEDFFESEDLEVAPIQGEPNLIHYFLDSGQLDRLLALEPNVPGIMKLVVYVVSRNDTDSALN